MKNIPHDYYLRFLDSLVFNDVLEFHSKGNFTIHEAFRRRTGLHSLEDKYLSQLSGNELILYPDMDLTIKIKAADRDEEDRFIRNESCERFLPSFLEFSEVENLIRPLLSRKEGSYKRGYPSGGALYPAEVFICSLTERNATWPAEGKVLHLLPKSKKFEVMRIDIDLEVLKAAILALPQDIGSPSIAIMYFSYLPKNLFKYRYRGYRMALMEIGSIYMLIELQARHLGLACRLWSAYTDSMLCKVLGVNPALFLPMCVHFIGKQHEND